MITLTPEELAQITELGRLFYTPAEVCTIMQLDTNLFKAHMATSNSDIYKAYWKGWFESDVAFRTEVKRTALLGSSPAQTLLGDIIASSKMKMLDQ